MDSRSRIVPTALGEFVDIRDQGCRTPWSDTPIRHHDHVVPVTEDGKTSEVNSQRLCESQPRQAGTGLVCPTSLRPPTFR